MAAVIAAVFGFITSAASQTEAILYSFAGPDGKNPDARLLRDKSGTLYGTSAVGGGAHQGTVYALTQRKDGSWKETVLHSFAGKNDGNGAWGGLIKDRKGVLYGITLAGGGQACQCGTAFALSETAGTWSESVIHAFARTDGDTPVGELEQDSSGNLYGVTLSGGKNDGGTIFELSRAGGSWNETILYNFCSTGGLGSCTDGEMPKGIRMDSSGVIFGTTQLGGDNGDGTIFELSNSGGTWKLSVLYNYESFDAPTGRLVEDSSGALYGATYEGGGGASCGNIFKFAQVSGVWKYSVLYTFSGGSDACHPDAGLHLESTGALYGTTSTGGAANDGTVFKVSKQQTGSWAETILHSFTGRPDGHYPLAAVIGGTNTDGVLYGVTDVGGENDKGAVFEIVP
jgi:uncharacterized repeat protein (TIGR03803 family)